MCMVPRTTESPGALFDVPGLRQVPHHLLFRLIKLQESALP